MSISRQPGGRGWRRRLLGVVAVVCSSLVWLVILKRLGSPVRWQSAAIYLQAQLGKYVPEGVWQYADRGAMARVHGFPMRAVARSLPIELAATSLAGAAFAFLAAWLGAIGVAAAIGAAAPVGAYLGDRQVRMTARAFVHVAPSEIALYTGAFAAAWIVGLLAIYAQGESESERQC
jgi:hypothetical protein